MLLVRISTSSKTTLMAVLPNALVRTLSYLKVYFVWKVILLTVFHFNSKSLYKIYHWKDRSLLNYMIGPVNRLE